MPPRKTKKIQGDHPVADHITYTVRHHPAELIVTYGDVLTHLDIAIHQKSGWQNKALIRLTPDACKELSDVLNVAFENATTSVQETL